MYSLPRAGSNPDFLFKIMLIGDGRVGKTSLIFRYLTSYFNEDYKRTIGVNISVKRIDDLKAYDRDNYSVELHIWDLGGQNKFGFLNKSFYDGTSGALLVYDITNFESYEHLDKWINELQRNTRSGYSGKHVPVIVLGNKADLEENRKVKTEDSFKWTREKDLTHIETSAKDGKNVEESFIRLAEIMVENYMKSS